MMSRHWKISTGRHFQNGHHNTAQIQHCPPQYRTISTLSNFNDISYVSRLWCPEFIPDIEKFLPVAIFKMAATQIPHCLISTSWIDSRHRTISTCLHFQNGHHNAAQIQHCSISKVAFDLFFKPVVSDQFGRLHNR